MFMIDIFALRMALRYAFHAYSPSDLPNKATYVPRCGEFEADRSLSIIFREEYTLKPDNPKATI